MSPLLRKGLVYAAVALALLTVALIAVRVVLGRSLSPHVVATRVSQVLGRDVSIESVGLRLQPGPILRIEGVSVGSGLVAGAAEVEIRIRRLLAGHVEAASVRVERARVSVERSEDGSLALAGLAPARGNASGEASASHPALPRIEIRDAAIRFVDHSAPGAPRATRLHVRQLDLRDLREGDTATFAAVADVGQAGASGAFELSGRIGPLSAGTPVTELPISVRIATVDLDPAVLVPFLPESWRIRAAEGAMNARGSFEGRLTGELAGDLAFHFAPATVDFAEIRFDGESRFETHMTLVDGSPTFSNASVRADRASFRGYAAREIRAAFAYSERTLAFESLAFQAYGGSWSQTGSVAFRDTIAFDVETHVEGVDVAWLASDPSGAGPLAADPPLLDGDGRFRGRWTGQENWLAPVEGSGELVIRGGEMPDHDLLESFARALTAAVPAIGRRSERPPLPKRTRLQSFSASFELESGRVRADDVHLITDDYRVRGEGSVGHDLALEVDADVAFTSQGLHKIMAIASVRARGGGRSKVPAIPVRVTGTLTDPRFAPELTGVPLAAMGALLWVGEQATGVVTETVGTVRDAAGATGNLLKGGIEGVLGSPEPDAVPPEKSKGQIRAGPESIGPD